MVEEIVGQAARPQEPEGALALRGGRADAGIDLVAAQNDDLLALIGAFEHLGEVPARLADLVGGLRHRDLQGGL